MSLNKSAKYLKYKRNGITNIDYICLDNIIDVLKYEYKTCYEFYIEIIYSKESSVKRQPFMFNTVENRDKVYEILQDYKNIEIIEI